MKPFSGEKKISWRSPSNIALVKYWGKHGIQLPQNPSLSFALKNSYTETSLTYSFNESEKTELEFLFEGKSNITFQNRINKVFAVYSEYLPFRRAAWPKSDGMAL